MIHILPATLDIAFIFISIELHSHKSINVYGIVIDHVYTQ